MNDNMVVEALRYMLAEVEEKLTSVEEENARLKERIDQFEKNVTAFAGQLESWGFDAAAKQIRSEIGVDVEAPNFYKLQAENARLREQLRWIPVGERLPEKNYSDIGDEVLVKLGYPLERTAAMKFDEGVFYSGGWGSPSTDWTDKVTHWMPLPEPPEVEE